MYAFFFLDHLTYFVIFYSFQRLPEIINALLKSAEIWNSFNIGF